MMAPALSMLIETHYLPSVEYFYMLSRFENIYIEACEHYQKQTFRNRCEILGANKVDILTVPVQKSGQKVQIREVKIDHHHHWQAIHWKALQSAYRNSPYFEYYGPYFYDILHRKHEYLFDLNMELMTLCLKLMRWNKEINFTLAWEKKKSEEIMDLRSKIHPKRDNNPFIEHVVPYRQVFGSNFVNNLSIVDLLFNEGPDSAYIIKQLKAAHIEQI